MGEANLHSHRRRQLHVSDLGTRSAGSKDIADILDLASIDMQ